MAAIRDVTLLKLVQHRCQPTVLHLMMQCIEKRGVSLLSSRNVEDREASFARPNWNRPIIVCRNDHTQMVSRIDGVTPLRLDRDRWLRD